MDSISTDSIALSCGNDVVRRSIAGALQGQGRNVELEIVPAAGAPPFDFTRCAAAILVHPGVTHDATDAAPGYQATREEAARSRCRLIEVVPVEATAPADADVLIRTAPVYGIGTDPLTTLFIMMRTLPAIPVLNTRSVARPVWHRDLAAAIAATLAPGSADRVLCDLYGPDAVTPDELYERIARLIDRHPLRVPIPEFLATPAMKLAASLKVAPAFIERFQAMFSSQPADAAATPDGCAPARTGIEEGLRLLIAELEELTPADGIGSIEVKRFSTTIRGAACDAIALMRLFAAQFSDIMPIPVGVEPASPEVVLRPGAAITMALPGRGHVQVRVREAAASHVTLATVRGHALAGIVRFSARDRDNGVEFEVMTCDAAANHLDWLTLTMGGARLQDANWATVVERVAQRAGGTHNGVQSDNRTLGEEEAASVERWVSEIAGGAGR